MATDLLDPSQIDAAVGNALGVQMPKQSAVGVTDQLLDRLKMVESSGDPKAVNKQSGAMGAYQFIPTTVQMLRNQGLVFDPFNEPQARGAAKQYLEQLLQRHGGNMELALRDYGGHSSATTPAAKKYISTIMGTADAAPAATPAAQPSALSESDLFSSQGIDAAVADAMGTPPPKGKVAQKTIDFLRSTGRATASMVDVPLNIATGLIDWAAYPLARAYYGFQMPPEEAAARAKAETTSPKDIVGTAFGVTETPEYKGEILRRVTEAAAEVPGWVEGKTGIPLTAKTISQKTGIPQSDVENALMSATMMVPAAAATKPGQAVTGAVGREVGYAAEAGKRAVQAVTPKPVQAVVGRTVETALPGTTGYRAWGETKPTLGMPGQPAVAPAVTGRASVGAAAVSDPAIIRQALQSATPEFQQLYGNMPLDKLNTPVVLRHLEADSLDVPVRLTKGQGSGDIVQLSKEQNARGSQPELAYRLNEQNQQLIDNLQARRERAAPDVYTTKTIDSSQALIDAYKELDKTRNTAIDAKFTELRDKAGGELPVDSPALLKNIDKQLSKELLLTDGQGISQYRELKSLAESGQMTFDQYLSMRRNLSRLSAEAKDGNVRQAARIMVQELDKLPLSNETAALKPIADQARNLARQRFDALKKDPAYKAAVTDSVPADKFFNKFVIGGVNKNINTMIDTLGRDSVGHQHIKAGTINYLSDKAGIIDGKGNFSQANYNKALEQLDKTNNFGAIFDPESQLKLRTLGNVAAYTQFQPRGHFINNSNTLVGWLANRAEQAGNLVGFGKYGIPAGTIVREKIKSAKQKKFAREALEPGAGSTLEEISNKGRQQPPASPTERIEPRLD